MTNFSDKKYVDNLFNHAETIFKLGFDERGACTALAYSNRLYNRCEYFRKEMEDLGMETHYDILGNLYGLLPGEVSEKILVLSHLDTVIDAGRYDGVLGVILPLEYVRWLKDNNQKLHYSLEILVCMGEESPGVTATFGSKSITGAYDLKAIKEMPLAYNPAVNVNQAIKKFFSSPDKQITKENLEEAQIKTEEYFKALEVHIEQYYLLKNRAEACVGKPYIGVMRGVGGHIRANISLSDNQFESQKVNGLKISFQGQTGHSGATPMGKDHRDDALVKAAKFLADLSVKKYKVSFGGIKVNEPSTTSIPYRVDILISAESAIECDIEKVLQNNDVSITKTVKPFQTVSNKLIYRLAVIILKLHNSAIKSPEEYEVRATVTNAFLNSKGGNCYCDIRGASEIGMKALLNDIKDLSLIKEVNMIIEVISKKEPVIFNNTKLEENLLEKIFEKRVMKGYISVPGQDIGVLSAYGLDTSLFFIESGTGHHPNEFVREEAMEQAFIAVKETINYWDTLKT